MIARLLDCTVDEYHALPHFSASRAKVILERSCKRAKAHVDKKPTKEMEFGDVGHALILGKGKQFKVLEFDDYRKKAAQEARDAARASGLVPILADEFERACVLVETLRVWLADSERVILDGVSEQVIEWTEQTTHGDVLCKGMLDHVWVNEGDVIDFKFTGNASLPNVERNAENMWYGVQEAAYTRALVKYRPSLAGRVRFRFCIVEVDAPHEFKLVPSDGLFKELGVQRWNRAVAKWAKCTAENRWPGYEYSTLSAPAWALRHEGFTSDE